MDPDNFRREGAVDICNCACHEEEDHCDNCCRDDTGLCDDCLYYGIN